VQTAQARSMNVQTAMNYNEYLWESQQLANQRYRQKQLGDLKDNVDARNAIYLRQRDNPTTSDINNGDALNIVLDELLNPKVYGQTLAAANSALPGSVVKQLPFAYNAAGITTTIDRLVDRDSTPEVFNRPEFAEQRQVMRQIVEEMQKETDNGGQPKSATLKKFRASLEKAKATLEATVDRNSREGTEGERYLKSLYGLSRMMESPSYDVYLASVDKQPSVPLRDVIQFMHAFNLRFGAAKTPDQREIYSQLYGTLSGLRQGVQPPSAQNFVPNNSPAGDQRATQVFAGMDFSHFNPPAGSGPQAPPARP
jgi:hypothetical protein